MPHAVRPGFVHLHNTGAHSFYVYRSRHGGADTFVRDFNSNTPTGLLRDFVSVDHLPGRSDLYADFSAGSYFLVDGDVYPIKKAWVSAVKVSGPATNSSMPTHAEPITIDAHDALGARPAISPDNPLQISVHDRNSQVLYLFHIGSSVAKGTVANFIAHPSADKYDELKPQQRIELAAVDGPQTIYTTWNAPRGRYVVFNTAYGPKGSLHLAHGQARLITVS